MNSVRETRFVAILLFCGSEMDKRYVFRSWRGEQAFLVTPLGCGPVLLQGVVGRQCGLFGTGLKAYVIMEQKCLALT